MFNSYTKILYLSNKIKNWSDQNHQMSNGYQMSLNIKNKLKDHDNKVWADLEIYRKSLKECEIIMVLPYIVK